MRHSKTRAVEMINARHHWSAIRDQILDQSRAVAGQIVARIHRTFPGAGSGPFKRALPITRQELELRKNGRAAVVLGTAGRYQRERTENRQDQFTGRSHRLWLSAIIGSARVARSAGM